MIKIKTEINETENSKAIEKKTWKKLRFFKRSTKLINIIINIRNEIGNVITDTTDIKRIVREYYKQLYTHRSENIGRNGPISHKVQTTSPHQILNR